MKFIPHDNEKLQNDLLTLKKKFEVYYKKKLN